MPAAPSLVLASASPRRSELLARVGVEFEVVPADIDEAVHPGETAEVYVRRVAHDKAIAVAAEHPDAIVLAADTAVVLDGEPLGKPLDATDARSMLERLVGRAHEVLTAVVVVRDGNVTSTLERAEVTMAAARPQALDWYVATGEPLDKAGSYAVQGIGAFLVGRIDGDPTTVIGLPLGATLELLRHTGLDWPAVSDAASDLL